MGKKREKLSQLTRRRSLSFRIRAPLSFISIFRLNRVPLDRCLGCLLLSGRVLDFTPFCTIERPSNLQHLIKASKACPPSILLSRAGSHLDIFPEITSRKMRNLRSFTSLADFLVNLSAHSSPGRPSPPMGWTRRARAVESRAARSALPPQRPSQLDDRRGARPAPTRRASEQCASEPHRIAARPQQRTVKVGPLVRVDGRTRTDGGREQPSTSSSSSSSTAAAASSTWER